MKEDPVSTSSEGDNRVPAFAAGGDGKAVNPGHKRLGSESSSSSNSSSEDPQTESPAVQLMERKSDAGSEENGHYRFPSSVFSRTKSSNTGKEWSINSNESLFSIHMGNMSFNKDLSWIAKSGELGKNGELLMSPRPPPLPELPPPPGAGDRQPPYGLPDYTPRAEGGKRKTKLDEGLCATPEAVETMKSILMENSGQRKEGVVASTSASLPRRSNESRDSTTSFAFPILTGNQSLKKSRQPKAREELAVESSKLQTPKAASDPPPSTGQAKWFGCFTCCSGGASSSTENVR